MADPVDTDALRVTASDLRETGGWHPWRDDEEAREHWTRIAAAADEVDRLREDVDRWHGRAAALQDQATETAQLLGRTDAEHDRLRAVIENAPHDYQCRNHLGALCDCWKVDSL